MYNKNKNNSLNKSKYIDNFSFKKSNKNDKNQGIVVNKFRVNMTWQLMAILKEEFDNWFEK